MTCLGEVSRCGFKFEPRDDEIVHLYLLNKLHGIPVPFHALNLIPDCDVYGAEEPWVLWDRLGGPTYNDSGFLYVFSSLKRRGSTFKRNVGSSGGTWHGEDTGKKFEAQGIRWTQKRFSYRNKKNKCENGCWLMQEYCLDQSDEIVLCRIKNNHKKRNDEDGDDGFGPKRARVDVVEHSDAPVPASMEDVEFANHMAGNIEDGDDGFGSRDDVVEHSDALEPASMEDIEFANHLAAQLRHEDPGNIEAGEPLPVTVTAAIGEEVEYVDVDALLQDGEQRTAFSVEDNDLANYLADQELRESIRSILAEP